MPREACALERVLHSGFGVEELDFGADLDVAAGWAFGTTRTCQATVLYMSDCHAAGWEGKGLGFMV